MYSTYCPFSRCFCQPFDFLNNRCDLLITKTRLENLSYCLELVQIIPCRTAII